MSKTKNISAGLLMYYFSEEQLRFFLVHPGGPYFLKKDSGWWTIPKGLPEREEDLLQTARREFEEETGIQPHGPFIPLGEIKQKGGKTVYAWAFEGEWDESSGIRCNNFKVEWPYKSGRIQEFPEVDQAAWFDRETAARKINEAQATFLDRLSDFLKNKGATNNY